ncbi:MAG TPA: sensor histidine kinase [Longimicrobiales bacterium]|nr:sensor histidine kinase [Longimicrobiales bacterium]
MRDGSADDRRDGGGRHGGWKAAALVFGVATLFGTMEGVQSLLNAGVEHHTLASLVRGVLGSLPPWYVLAALTPGVLWLAGRFPLMPWPRPRDIGVHAAASLAFPVLHLAGTALANRLLHGLPLSGVGLVTTKLIGLFYAMEVLEYWGIVVAYEAWAYYRRYRVWQVDAARMSVRAAQLEASLAQAKLQALSAQLHPHFLFNTLNAIAVLARGGRRSDVVTMVTRLARLLRISVDEADATVPLQRELSFLRRYLAIEHVRFRERLSVRWSIAPECRWAEVPTLLLQPLVENAIRHGIAQQPGPGRIEIRARRVDAALHLSVRDNGPGLVGGVGAVREGVGLRNTRERLEQLYGPDHSFHLQAAPGGGFLVTITLPFRPAAAGVGDEATSPARHHVEDPHAHR